MILKKIGIYLFLVLIAFFVFGMSSPPKESGEVVDFNLQEIHSEKEISLSDYKGKIVLLDFFAIWCPPCREQMDVMNKVHDTFSDKGVVVIGVSIDKRYNRQKVIEFLKEKKVEFLTVWAESDLVDLAQVRAIPTLLVVDKKGQVDNRYVGYHDFEFFDTIINRMLKKS